MLAKRPSARALSAFGEGYFVEWEVPVFTLGTKLREVV
jgi:hypothetical protein